MKTKEKVVDAEFRMDDQDGPRRSSHRARAENTRRNRRGSWVNLLLVAIPAWIICRIYLIASGIGRGLGEIIRFAAVPVMRFATIGATFTAMCLGVMYLGAYAIRGGVAKVRDTADSWHSSLNRGTETLLAMVPSSPGQTPSEGEVPRAVPVMAGYRPGYPQPALLVPDDRTLPLALSAPAETETPSLFPKVLSEMANGAANLLLPSLYPEIEGLPRIEGDVLELAGGHRMQQLISSILPAIHQVESSGRQELIGDGGLAYGPLQVRHEPCEDLKEFFGVDIDPAKCNGDYALSEYVVRLYLGYWGVQHELRTGKVATAKDLCRTWNGGPDQGPYKKTDAYWARCQSHDRSIATLAAQ